MTKQIVDKSAIIIPSGAELEDFKRPNHPDFMTSSELKKVHWSGIRHNSVSDCAEVWLEGECMKSVSALDVAVDPQAINKAVAEVFALEEVQPNMPELKQFRKSSGNS